VNDDSLDRWGKKKALLKIKSVFENHIVSVRLKSDDFATLGLAVSENLGYVPYNKLDVYYDNETGFKKRQVISSHYERSYWHFGFFLLCL